MILVYNIENEKQILFMGTGNYCSKLKKEKLKTKELMRLKTKTSDTFRKYLECIYQNLESAHHTPIYHHSIYI